MRQPRNPRTPRPDKETLTPEQVKARHLHQLNDLTEKTIEASAIDLRHAGFTSYGAALRGLAVSNINVICMLNEPSRIRDLECIRDHIDDLIHDLKHPRVA